MVFRWRSLNARQEARMMFVEFLCVMRDVITRLTVLMVETFDRIDLFFDWRILVYNRIPKLVVVSSS